MGGVSQGAFRLSAGLIIKVCLVRKTGKPLRDQKVKVTSFSIKGESSKETE